MEESQAQAEVEAIDAYRHEPLGRKLIWDPVFKALTPTFISGRKIETSKMLRKIQTAANFVEGAGIATVAFGGVIPGGVAYVGAKVVSLAAEAIDLRRQKKAAIKEAEKETAKEREQIETQLQSAADKWDQARLLSQKEEIEKGIEARALAVESIRREPRAVRAFHALGNVLLPTILGGRRTEESLMWQASRNTELLGLGYTFSILSGVVPGGAEEFKVALLTLGVSKLTSLTIQAIHRRRQIKSIQADRRQRQLKTMPAAA